VVLGFGVAFGLKPHEMGEAILLAAIPCGFFGVLTGLSYGVKSQDANSTLTLTTIASSVTLAVVIILTNGMK
jgi:predicted permease